MLARICSRFAIAVTLVSIGCAIGPPAARAAGTVGNGTAGSCTEGALNTALTGGGSVTFDCGGPATITFSATKSIATATTITGNATGVTLSGGGAVRLFNVTGGSLTFDQISLVDGHDSATQIGAAAIDASAPVTITDSTISGHQTTNGGCPAIATTSSLTITRSTITGNVNAAASTGEAVCGNNTSSMTITDSTFTANTGGAIDTSGAATITNTTIAGNTATGAGNTAGVVAFGSSGVVTLRNTIVANNTPSGPSAGQCAPVAGGVVNDGGGNLQFPDNLCGATIPVADPLLGPLASNGGPTQTMALAFGSPAIDAAVAANCPPTDQRGQVPVDGNGDGIVVCDTGAYEFVPTLAQIPTLDRTGVVGLALLLASLAFVALRRRGS